MASVTDTYSSSSINNTVMALEKFPQDGKSPSESFNPFFDSLCDLASTFTASNSQFGLLGAVLSAAQYEVISPGRPFVILANPGPPLPLAAAPVRRTRDVNIRHFEIQQLDLRQLKKIMLVRIHSTFINLMSESIVRMTNRSIQWITQDFLYERYGRLTPLEMEEVFKRLDEYYSPDTHSLAEHFATHVQAHNTAMANNSPFPEREKVAKLRGSLIPCGLYPAAIDAWAREFPTIAVQTFQNLQDAIQLAENNRDRLATAATSGYGVAAAVRSVSVPIAPTDTSILLAQFAAMAARLDAWETKTNSSLPSKKDTPNQYCHTHGLCAHSSKDCRTPGPTHNAKATAKNTLGGASATRRARRN